MESDPPKWEARVVSLSHPAKRGPQIRGQPRPAQDQRAEEGLAAAVRTVDGWEQEIICEQYRAPWTAAQRKRREAECNSAQGPERTDQRSSVCSGHVPSRFRVGGPARLSARERWAGDPRTGWARSGGALCLLEQTGPCACKSSRGLLSTIAEKHMEADERP